MKDKTYPIKISIDDGYCEYQLTIPTDGTQSITSLEPKIIRAITGSRSKVEMAKILATSVLRHPKSIVF
jgi:hypothetical protein